MRTISFFAKFPQGRQKKKGPAVALATSSMEMEDQVPLQRSHIDTVDSDTEVGIEEADTLF